MAKTLRNQPVTAADLSTYLATADDFAFELQCLHALSERKPVRLEHGGSYTDPVTQKPRQFDVRAYIESVPLRVSMAIECKNLSPAYPLVVSRVPRVDSEAFHQLLVPYPESDLGTGKFGLRVPTFQHTQSVTVSAPNSLYKIGEWVGKSVARVGVLAASPNEYQSDNSEVFERWAQAVASAHDLISDADKYFRNRDADLCTYWIVPVLVVPEGTLWVADYDKSGAVLGAPKQVDATELYLDHSTWQRGQLFGYTISHLHFVTLKGLLSLVDRVLINEQYRKEIVPTDDEEGTT